MAPLDGSLGALLDQYGFVPSEARARWHFEGHPTQCCSVELDIAHALFHREKKTGC